ncbi:Hpt domain-containing response regulator [Terriglobus tenax]|uniref:Hpt domain-containing response regulator n=1 Tax=Terriglobus tenax TaxID=1111115 RepID=UPI0021E0E100|nr:response regulator [Terriglobus tenax]
MATNRILVIEDDPMSLELLDVLLTQEGFAVTGCGSGEDALAAITQHHDIHFVLTDLQIPGLRGPALAAALRKATPAALRIFAMSATAPEHRLPGFDAFLLKPLSMERFLSLVHGSGSHRAAVPQESHLLDENIYRRMANAMPPAQLQATYTFALDDAIARIEAMRVAFAANDNSTFRRQAHSIKGGCAMVGAVELASIASIFERNGITGKQVGTDLDEFHLAADRLRRMLETRF